MAQNHIVVKGDTLSGIAKKHGFKDWRTIYNDPSNAAFRRKRPNPNLIFPGDVVVIPAGGGGIPGPPQPPPRRLPDLPFTVSGQRFLVGQPNVKTCWAAGLTMFKSWKAVRKLEIREVLKNSAPHLRLFDQQQGIAAEDLPGLAAAFNLKVEPEDKAVVEAIALATEVKGFDPRTLAPSMFSPAVFLSLMDAHGLLIVASFTKAGNTLNLGGHIRVMFGMEGSLTDVDQCRVKLMDPFVPNSDAGVEVTIAFTQFILEYFTMFFAFHRQFGTASLVQILHA
jgi:hypothetical protein